MKEHLETENYIYNTLLVAVIKKCLGEHFTRFWVLSNSTTCSRAVSTSIQVHEHKNIKMGHMVMQLVEAPRYRLEGHRFDFQWCHRNISLTLSWQLLMALGST